MNTEEEREKEATGKEKRKGEYGELIREDAL